MDPEVLHTNPNVPIDEDGTGSEAIFAGLNDEHVLLVQAKSLVGNSEIVDGPAETIIPILPLVINNRELYLDQTSFNALLAGLQSQITALQTRATADETLIANNTTAIANNTTAIANNTTAIATNAAAIAVLQQQLAALTQHVSDVVAALKPGSLFPFGNATFVGAGALSFKPGLYTNITNLATLAGSGALTSDLGKVPKSLFPGNVIGAGALTAVVNSIPSARANLAGAGQLVADALVKSLIIKTGDWVCLGVGVLTAPKLNAMLTAAAPLTGAGALLGRAGLPFLLPVRMAGAGAMPAVTASTQPSSLALDPANTGSNIILSNANHTATGSGTLVRGFARGLTSRTIGGTGKYYFEATVNAVNISNNNVTGAGLVNASASSDFPLASDTNGYGIMAEGPTGQWAAVTNSSAYSLKLTDTPSVGDVLMLAFDSAKGLALGVNGNWIGGLDPNSGGLVYVLSGTWYPALGLSDPTEQLTINTSGPFVYLPTGYVAWG